MKIAILKETRANETRVAGSPEVVKKLIGLGFQVAVQQDAGAGASFTDAAFRDAAEHYVAATAVQLDRFDAGVLRGIRAQLNA